MQYWENRRCPKCGSLFIRTRYDCSVDALRRSCERCGYHWKEKPLDADGKKEE